MASPKDKSQFKVVFRGVRGSYPVSGEKYLKYGGYTSCYEIRVGGCLIIIDAGTGIINLGQQVMDEYLKSGKDLASRKPVEAIVLFTHVHIDHVQGLPFFTLLHLPDSTLYFYGSDVHSYMFEEALNLGIEPPFFPIDINQFGAVKYFRSIFRYETILWGADKGAPVVINNFRELEQAKKLKKQYPVKITFMKSYAHPNDGVLVFKIEYKKKSVVIATDTEGYVFGDTKLINFSKGADLLIHDAGYTRESYTDPNGCKQGYGHSTPEMAVEVAQKAGVKKLGLVHHEPANDDAIVDKMQDDTKKLFPNSFAAREGQEIIL